jgi:hypothetical protein
MLCPNHQTLLMERFDTRLPEHSEIIKQILIENNAVISGSFILELINDAKYSCSDIDFFISSSSENIDKTEAIIKSFWKNEEPRDFTHYTKCKEILNIYDKIVCTDINNRGYSNINFQLIIVDCPCITEYIQNFDIDVCKNYFDGKNFYSYYYDDILTKKTTIHCSEHFKVDMGLMLWRFIKYAKRGYSIRFDDDFNEYVDVFKRFYFIMYNIAEYNRKTHTYRVRTTFGEFDQQLETILNDRNVKKIFLQSSKQLIPKFDEFMFDLYRG